MPNYGLPWDIIGYRLISGYLPVMVLLIIYFVILQVSGKKQKVGHIILSFVFEFYLVGILVMTGIWFKPSFSPRIVYIPFVDMIRGPVDTVLNVFLFIPLGFFLPIMYERHDRIIKILLTGLFISLSVELVQLFGSGATDINDLITNTVGTCIRYGLCKIFQRIVPKSWFKALSIEENWCYPELTVFWIGNMFLMITVQPVIYQTIR